MLFSNNEEIRKYVAVNKSLEIARLMPDIRWAEEKYIVPVLGQDMYDELDEAYNDESSELSDELAALLEKVQMPLVHLALSKFMVLNQLQLDNSGVSFVSDNTRKTAFQWQVEQLKGEYFLEKAYDGIDYLMAFLEKNKTVDAYSSWLTGEGFTINKKFFINSCVTFQEYVNIGDSRLTFNALFQQLRASEDFFIAPALGEAFFTALKNKIKAGTVLSDEEKTLVEKIVPALAYHTAANAVLNNVLGMRSGGWLIETFVAINDNMKQVSVFTDQQLSRMHNDFTAKANAYLGKMKTYLKATASATVFNPFYTSELYSRETARAQPFKNKPENKIVVI